MKGLQREGRGAEEAALPEAARQSSRDLPQEHSFFHEM